MNPPAGAISLSQAAKLSGYHQDYLGQLCRAGKLQATKIGRTWFTTEGSVQDFLRSLQGESQFDFISPEPEEFEPQIEEPIRVQSLPTPSMDSAGPQVSENLLISEVEGLPISLEARPQVIQPSRAAALDGVITKVRLQQVQRDLEQLTSVVEQLAGKVDDNSSQIERLIRAGIATPLKHNYTPSLDVAFSPAPQIRQINLLEPTPQPKSYNGRILIVTGTMALIAVAVMLAVNPTWQTKFFGQESKVTTLYHSLKQPQVAGDTVIVPTTLDQGSATVTNNNSNINKVPPAPSTPGETLGGIGAGNLLQ